MPRPRQRPSNNLAELRIARGLSARELGRLANVSPQVIWNAEHGSVPRNDAQLRIARVFGLTPLDLWPLQDELDEEPEAAVA